MENVKMQYEKPEIFIDQYHSNVIAKGVSDMYDPNAGEWDKLGI